MKRGTDDESNSDNELMTRFGIMLEKILDQNHDGLVDEKEMSDALQKVGKDIHEVSAQPRFVKTPLRCALGIQCVDGAFWINGHGDDEWHHRQNLERQG